MKNIYRRFNNFLLSIIVTIMTSSAWADFPKPASEDMADSTKDWIDIGGSLGFRGAKIVCVLVGVGILVGAASGIISAFRTVHERQDYGHFFKVVMVGLAAAALGTGLLYA